MAPTSINAPCDYIAGNQKSKETVSKLLTPSINDDASAVSMSQTQDGEETEPNELDKYPAS